MKLLLDITNIFGHRTQFQFRFDVHLVVQVRLDAVFGSLPVLADQDKNGKKELCCIGTHIINPSFV
jgi:hypothetical protein